MLRQILSASGSVFFGLGVLMVAGIEMASAIAPIDIEVPPPQCANGKPRNANNECPGDGDGVFRPSLKSGRRCQMPGTPPATDLPKCVLGVGSGNARASGRDLPKHPADVSQPKGQGMWQVCISTPQNPGGRCWGEMSRSDAEDIAKSHMDDPDLESGVKVWAQEIRG